MNSSTVRDVLSSLANIIPHVPYAACGLGAMVAYGFKDRLPSHVSIICPVECKDVIRPWVATCGSLVPAGEGNRNPDQFGLRIGNKTRRVRIKFVSDQFKSLEVVDLDLGGLRKVKALSLAAIADFEVARSWVSGKTSSQEDMETLQGDMLWLLQRIIEMQDPQQAFTPRSSRNIRNGLFWDVFNVVCPEAESLFSAAGLEVPVSGVNDDTEPASSHNRQKTASDSDSQKRPAATAPARSKPAMINIGSPELGYEPREMRDETYRGLVDHWKNMI